MTAPSEQVTESCAYPPHPHASHDTDATRTAPQPPAPMSPPRSGIGGWFLHAPTERLPLALLPATWCAAEFMHAFRVTPLGPGVATLVAAAVAFGAGERRTHSVDRPTLSGAECAAVIGVPGIWAAIADAIGPLSGPYDLMTSVAFSAIALGGYWWLRTRSAVRAARKRRDDAAAEAERLAAEEAAWLARKKEWHRLAPLVGLQGSDLLRVQTNQNGSETWTIDLYGAHRTLADHVQCKTVAQRLSGERLLVTGGRRVPKSRIEVAPDPDMAYHLLITIRGEDLWQGGTAASFIWHPCVSGEWDPTLPYAEWAPDVVSIRDPIVIGVDPELGTPLEIVLWDEDQGSHRVLVVGTSGSGKSMLLDTIRERVTACEDAILIQVNLSKGVEDSWWEPLTPASALKSVHGDEAHARALRILDFISAVIEERPRTRTPGVRIHQPTPGAPAIVLMIDEVDKVANDDERKRQLGEIASKCRSEGVTLILGAQRPINKIIGGDMVRANISDVVWGRMRSTDTRHAAGGDSIELPNMGDYGGGNAGVFGVAQHPTFEGMDFQRGRAWYWGKNSPGLIKLIKRRAATRPRYTLERGLARLTPAWDEIVGTVSTRAADAVDAPAPPVIADQSRYDVKPTRDGSTIPSGAGIQRKLDNARAILDADLSPELRARMAAGTPDAKRAEEKLAELASQPLPEAEQAQLWKILAESGGISGREAASRLERARPVRGRATWSHTTVINQLRLWEAKNRVHRTGRGRSDTQWHIGPADSAPEPPAPYLHAVESQPPAHPDSSPAAATHPAASGDRLLGDTPVPESADVTTPRVISPMQLALMVAFWVLNDGMDHALAAARHNQIPDATVQWALHLAEHETTYVKRHFRQVLRNAGAPLPAWLNDAADTPTSDRSAAP